MASCGQVFNKNNSNPYISELVLGCAPEKYKVQYSYEAINFINSINKFHKGGLKCAAKDNICGISLH